VQATSTGGSRRCCVAQLGVRLMRFTAATETFGFRARIRG
jgi:hypothetical protein